MTGPFLDDYIFRAAERAPDAPAFRFDGAGLSYGDLADKVTRFAAYLASAGVGRGDLVGIHMHKSLDLPVVVFGVLAAGAGYVPLDPNAPDERVIGVAQDCELKAVAVGRHLLQRIPAFAQRLPGVKLLHEGQEVVENAERLSDAISQPRAPLNRRLARLTSDTCYVIFTSGSTGTPKGIVQTHASAMSYAEMAADLYGLGPKDRMANVTPLHFDMSTFEFFAGPARGACTILVPEAFALMPANLSAHLESERATTLYAVPFALIQMSEKGGLDDKDLSALRWIVHAGEPMAPGALARLQRQLPQTRFSNSYGPAEVNQATYHHYPAGPVSDDGPLPLGRACPNSRLRIDPDTDELLVCSTAMMAGYWGRSSDAECGIVSLADDDGVTRRYYRTGDIVGTDARGLLYFRGRADRQVKIRGFRVELDEVELALNAADGVAEAAAVHNVANMTVAGFIRPKDGCDPTPQSVAASLRSHLPAHAMPKSITIMSEFPRTGTDKIDRKKLIGN